MASQELKLPKLTDAEMARYRTKFKMFDRNNDGQIEARELAQVARALGHKMTQEQINGLIGQWDLDANGVLTFDEFLCCMHANKSLFVKSEQKKVKLRKLLASNADDSGQVAVPRMVQVLVERLGFPPDRSSKLCSTLDPEDTGNININAFVEFYCKIIDGKQNLEKSLEALDSDGSEAVASDVARGPLEKLELSSLEVDAMIAVHDKNRNRYFWYKELSEFWLVPQ